MKITENMINRFIVEAIKEYMRPKSDDKEACINELEPFLDSLLGKYGNTALYEAMNHYMLGLEGDLRASDELEGGDAYGKVAENRI